MAMNLKLEYLVLIFLGFLFYFYALRDDLKKRENKKFIKSNLKVGYKVVTESKIIGEVVSFNKIECLLVTGKNDKVSYILVKFDSIESIIET